MLSKLATFVALAEAGKCPFGFDNDSNETASTRPLVQSSVSYPSEIFTCSGTRAATTTTFSRDTYKAIVADVIAKYEATNDSVGANTNTRGKYAGCIVRTAGHDFMDFRKASDGTTSGGSDGCINFADEDNTGLPECLTSSGLAAVYEKYCTTVSLADFLVIIGEAVMGRTAERYNPSNYYETGSVAQAFLENFKYGRTTALTCPSNTGLMPNPENGCDGLKNIFVDHIYAGTGREWEFTAAISGAHTLGSASIANSGYNGFWSSADQ